MVEPHSVRGRTKLVRPDGYNLYESRARRKGSDFTASHYGGPACCAVKRTHPYQAKLMELNVWRCRAGLLYISARPAVPNPVKPHSRIRRRTFRPVKHAVIGAPRIEET